MSEDLAGAVSASVAELVQGTASTVMLNKSKIATMVLLAVSALGGASAWAYRGLATSCFTPTTQPAELPAAKADDNKAPSPKRDKSKMLTIQGRILGPDGKPKAGVKLLLLGPLDSGEQGELVLESGKVQQLGVSAADGGFSVAVSKERLQHFLIAQSGGAGIDFADIDDLKSGNPIELQLVKDHAIRGRVVNTEGKPMAGVRVAANYLGIYPDNSLDSFLVFWKNRPHNWGLRRGLKDIWSGVGAVLSATTDADGRFALHGVGVERLVSLRLSGRGIAADEVWVANRAGFDPKPYNRATLDNIPKGGRGFNGRWMLSGPDVSVVAAPEKLIRGVVTETDTGKGRSGIIVRLTRKNGSDRDGGDYLPMNLQAKTDAKGRYEIHGAQKTNSYMVQVGSDSTAGYLGRAVWVEDTPGYRPLTADIRVRKGVIVTGRMIDKTTDKPVKDSVVLTDLFDNPFVKEYSDDSFHSVLIWATSFHSADANGVFRAVTIPGPVLLMCLPHEDKNKYKSVVPDPDYPKYFRKRGDDYGYAGSGSTILWGSYCKVFQIKPGDAVVEHHIALERRNVLGVVKIQDAEGKPLSDVDAWGIANWMEGDCCTIYGDADGKRLRLLFHEAKRKLAGSLTLKAGDKLLAVVKLRAMGSVKGRLLDADGKPLAGIVVSPNYRDRAAGLIDNRAHGSRPITSDANGNFNLDSVIPELPFALTFRRGRRDYAREMKPTETSIQVKTSECCDVGAIKLKLAPEKKEE